MVDRGTTQTYLDAALSLLDEHGLADQTTGLTVKGVCAGAGVSRSTLYRHWPTVADLNTDMAALTVCRHPGWQQRILAVPPAASLDDALDDALCTRTSEIGVAVRAMAAGWHEEVEARQIAARWERSWLDRFGEWIDAHCSAHGRAFADGADPLLAAVAIAAIVEGWMLNRVIQGDQSGGSLDRPIEPLHLHVGNFLEQITEPSDVEPTAASGDPLDLEPIDGLTYPAAKLAVAERFIDSWAGAPYDERWMHKASRIVDIERLARREEVSVRYLFDLWPTTSDFNAAIVDAWFRRLRDSMNQIAIDWINQGSTVQYVTPLHRFTHTLDTSLREALRTDRANVFACTQALREPAVRAVTATIAEEWRINVRTLFLAILGLSGRYRRAGITADDYATSMQESSVGFLRIIALNPSLADVQVSYHGDDHPLCGIVPLHLGHSLSTPDRPPDGSD